MCIPAQALVSGLVLRITEGYVATERDLRALLGSGCTKDQLREAFVRARSTQASEASAESRAKSDRFDQALAQLDALDP